MRFNVYGLLSILLLFVVWGLYAAYIDNTFILPKPVMVLERVLELLQEPNTYLIIMRSFTRLLIAIASASIIAIILGLLAGAYKQFSEFLQPLVTSLRTLPVASIIVILLILVSRGTAIYVITFLMIFPVLYESSKQGVLNIDPSIKHALALDPHRRLQILMFISLPLAFPYIKTGFLQSIGLGFKVLVMAEFIAQTPTSIGKALYDGSIIAVQYDSVFAWTLIIILIVTVIEKGVHKISLNR